MKIKELIKALSQVESFDNDELRIRVSSTDNPATFDEVGVEKIEFFPLCARIVPCVGLKMEN